LVINGPSRGHLCKHPLANILLQRREVRKRCLSDTNLTRTLFVDDTAFIFLTRDDRCSGSKLIVNEFARFSLKA
jgi:hypothetical protein